MPKIEIDHKYHDLVSQLQSLLVELREEEQTAIEMGNPGINQGGSFARVRLEVVLDSLDINRPRVYSQDANHTAVAANTKEGEQ